jgi:hypothetical protein
LDIFAIGKLKTEWSTIHPLLAFFRFQMEISELRNGANLKDPFTVYGSLSGNLNAIMTSAKKKCFRSCTSKKKIKIINNNKKKELWSRLGDEHLYATIRISSASFKADI